MKKLYLLTLLPLILLGACSEPAAPPAVAGNNETEVSPPAEAQKAIGTPVEQIVETPDKAAAKPAESDGVVEMEWDDLIPADYRPDKILDKYDLDNMTDDDPRADQLEKELRELWDTAPVRTELDAQRIKLPGFVVPVETNAEESTGFLLVPYYGACIHVPPPPANQTVYVVTEKGKGVKPNVFDVVWVTGDLSVKRIDNEVAEAGYTIYASNVEPYE